MDLETITPCKSLMQIRDVLFKVSVQIHIFFVNYPYYHAGEGYMQVKVTGIGKEITIKLKRLLPPANEVWGKVIFSQACVKNSVHGGEGGAIPACIAGGIPACLAAGLQGWGGVLPGGLLRGITPPPWTATAAGGTHPTGMHSCLK